MYTYMFIFLACLLHCHYLLVIVRYFVQKLKSRFPRIDEVPKFAKMFREIVYNVDERICYSHTDFVYTRRYILFSHITGKYAERI